ncbi:MAG: hypothetical protein HOB56_04205 [Proteobacteria bacterium]|nr:hypothetical protein [Pseudomonadota bacterium]MBT6656962.1 hypothetical protein [Pseudomonadota bacterium]MBT7110257.1 hypothetical protein [Pseudomonadota bacterium]MBT7813060.1 hypothetical protein [Pseudomonadota bacterium]
MDRLAMFRTTLRRFTKSSAVILWMTVLLVPLLSGFIRQAFSDVAIPTSPKTEATLPEPQLNFQTLFNFSDEQSVVDTDELVEFRGYIDRFGTDLEDLSAEQLNSAGLSQLQLFLVDQVPLARGQNSRDRQLKRWQLLDQQADYEELHRQLWRAFLDDESPIRFEIGIRLASSILKNGHPSEARDVYRRLLAWPDIREGVIRQARYGIIQTFFAQEYFEDASLAARTFETAYRPDQPSWKILKAQIAISLDQPYEAIAGLNGIASPTADLWRTFAQWLNSDLSDSEALHQLGLVSIPSANRNLKVLREAIIVRIADSSEYAELRARGIEFLIESEATVPSFFNFDLKPSLLVAYVDVAENVLKNRGIEKTERDRAWRLVLDGKNIDILHRRALGIFLNRESNDPERSLTSYEWLVENCAEDGSDFLLSVFFGEEGVLEKFQNLDDGVLILLVDWALRQSDVSLAANLQSLIDSPPPGVNIDAWTLRSARIQVLGGKPEIGANQLVAWFSTVDLLSLRSLDRAMQIVFDLQFLGEHEIAIRLFKQMAHLIRTAEQKKELFYWMAQSWAGLGDYPRAAIYYLESASLTGESDLLWRQSAFYKAGQSLEDAGYYSDAKKVYTMLLGNSSDPKILAKLQYRLAQIQLAEIHRGNP